MQELARLEPGNALLTQEYRTQMYDEAYKAAVDELMMQREHAAQIKEARKCARQKKWFKRFVWCGVIAIVATILF